MDEQERLIYLGWAKTNKFQSKVAKAKQVIQEALKIGDSYVAISWGKDSTVLLHLCQQVCPNIKAFFAKGFYMDIYDNYTEVMNKYLLKYPTNIELWEDNNVPTNTPGPIVASKEAKLSLIYDVVFLGLRQDESINRKRSIKKGLIYKYKNSNTTRVCPLGYWSNIDIWSYIALHELPYLNSYDTSNKLSKESRTSAHLTPHKKYTSLGESVLEKTSYNSLQFKQLIKEIEHGSNN